MGCLRIAITCYPSVGGSGIVAVELGKALAERGHEIHFISYERPFRLDFSAGNIHFHKVHINTYSLFQYPDYTLPLAAKICSVVQAHHIDVLHMHYAVPHATAALLARAICREQKCGKPVVVTTLHGTDITLLARDPALHSVIKYSIEESTGVTAVSRNLRTETQKVFRIQKEISVIYNFYDTVPAVRKREDIRKEIGVPDDAFLLVHISNLRPVKRVRDIIDVCARANRRYRAKREIYLLVLAGDSFDAYWQYAAKRRIRPHVRVYECVRAIEDFIPAADAGIFLSEYESFGMGILEVMSYGIPVIATRVGGIPEVVEEGAGGFLYSLGDKGGAEEGIGILLSDEKKRREMGTAARARAERLFSKEHIVRQYEEYYHSLLEKKQTAV